MLKIEKNRPLAPYTTLKIGGPAEFFCEPSSTVEIKEALVFAANNGSGVTWFGGGSNVLVHDRGVRGLVIRLSRRFSKIHVGNDSITVDAGCWLPSLMKYGCDHGILDLSFCAGIPGTVGGAVFMNAGTQKGAISDKLMWAEVMDTETQTERRLYRKEMEFSYRSSMFQSQRFIVTRVGFKKESGDGRLWWNAVKEQVRWRKERQPKGVRSAGCFFKNPRDHSAGALIDKAGLKGMRVGDALVSPVHANFLVNAGKATSADFTALTHEVKKGVFNNSGVHLSLEVCLLGFEEAEFYTRDHS